MLRYTWTRAVPAQRLNKLRCIGTAAENLLNVVLIGRPNTGKSTLFNRLTKTRAAIVSNIPGTTRDRREGKACLAGLDFRLIDTGGLDDRGAMSANIQVQVEQAIANSDVVLLMIDAKEGVTALDEYFVKWLRKRINAHVQTSNSAEGQSNNNDNTRIDREVVVIANKTEGARLSDTVLGTVSDTLRFGFGEPLLLSASHGDGLSDLAGVLIRSAQRRGLDNLNPVAPSATATISVDGSEPMETEDMEVSAAKDSSKGPALEDRVIQLAIMGRPNVGKSTLLNAFLGQERSITGPIPGLTRDAVHAEWKYNDRTFRLVDTAGITHMTPAKEILSKGDKIKSIDENLSESEIDVKLRREMKATIAAVRENARLSSLPGITDVSADADPSQFSHYISEMSLLSALNALRYSQVVLLVVEGTQRHFSKVELQLAYRCFKEGRALVIAANKRDLVTEVSLKEYEAGVSRHANEFLREFGEVPVVSSCGIKKEGIGRLLRTVIATHDGWSKRFSTATLNRWLKDLLVTTKYAKSAGTSTGNSNSINIKFITQVKSRPPTFAIFCNKDELPQSLERFLKSSIQRDFALVGVPVRFIVKKTIRKVQTAKSNKSYSDSDNNESTESHEETLSSVNDVESQSNLQIESIDMNEDGNLSNSDLKVKKKGGVKSSSTVNARKVRRQTKEKIFGKQKARGTPGRWR